jgi:hypothetical protein
MQIAREQDQETYIYLTQAHFTNSIELSLKWTGQTDNKLTPLSVTSTCSFEFLSVRIGEVMEKFSVFEGLNNLRACNLTKNKQPLPLKGEIAKHCKAKDVISFDLASLDLWLTVVISAVPLKSDIGFQVKVPKSYTVQQLKEVILNCFMTLSQAPLSVAYYTLEMRQPVDRTYSPLANLADFNAMKLVEEPTLEVKDLFDYLTCDLVCRINHDGRVEDASGEGKSSHLVPSLPIRKISVTASAAEAMALPLTRQQRVPRQDNEEKEPRCLGCALI